MWADWLRNYIPREIEEHHVALNTFFPKNPQNELRRRTGDPHSTRIKCVCGKCNRVWMSRLQERAKPYLVPMLRGHSIELHRNGQTAIAAWVAMMVMVAENMYPETSMVAVSAKDRRWLYSKHQPPSSRWRVWIGQHARKEHELLVALGTENEAKRLPFDAAADPNTQTTTVCLGDHLVIHVMSSDRVWPFVQRWRLPTHVASVMTQIWPIRRSPVAWPTADAALNDKGLDLLAMRFFNDIRVYAESTWPSS